MRKLYAVIVLVTVFGAIAAQFHTRNDGIDTSVQVSDATDEYVYRKLANGTIIHELVDPKALPDIAPAAGGEDELDANGLPKTKYKYDPLTQTYRRSTIDFQGNTSEDIRYPVNP